MFQVIIKSSTTSYLEWVELGYMLGRLSLHPWKKQTKEGQFETVWGVANATSDLLSLGAQHVERLSRRSRALPGQRQHGSGGLKPFLG